MNSPIGAIVLISGIAVWSRRRDLSFSGDFVFLLSHIIQGTGQSLHLSIFYQNPSFWNIPRKKELHIGVLAGFVGT